MPTDATLLYHSMQNSTDSVALWACPMPYFPFRISNPQSNSCSMVLQDAESNWQFDIFTFAEMTPGSSLSMLSFHLLKSTGLIKEYELNEAKLVACLRKIESGYDPANPYHNRLVRGLYGVINVERMLCDAHHLNLPILTTTGLP